MISPISSRSNRSACLLLSFSFALPAVLGCDKSDPEPQPQTQATPAAPAEAVRPGQPASDAAQPAPTPTTPAGDVRWDVPPSWKEMPQRPMRKATYEAPGAAGASEIAVFYFGPDQGGGVEANIKRWIAQFPDLPEGSAKRSEEEVNGMKRVNVDIDKGTFASGMPGAPAVSKDNWAMSASIVQTPSGHYYFKMTGPAASVAAEKPNFTKLLSSVRFEEKN